MLEEFEIMSEEFEVTSEELEVTGIKRKRYVRDPWYWHTHMRRHVFKGENLLDVFDFYFITY